MIYITHDIDWISPLHPFSVAKTFTHGSKWLRFGKIFQPAIFTKQIDRLIRFNEDNQVQSVWLTGAPHKHSYQKFGLRYTADCHSYNNVIRKLTETRCEIGLHSVMNESFSRQVEWLSAFTGRPINFHRSHYLRFNEKLLFSNLQQQGIKTDFSFGNARKVEIPSNIPHITLGISCVATVLFDNAFFFHAPETVFTRFRSVLQEASKAGLDIAVLFHPENFAVNPALWEYYPEVLNLIRQSGLETLQTKIPLH